MCRTPGSVTALMTAHPEMVLMRNTVSIQTGYSSHFLSPALLISSVAETCFSYINFNPNTFCWHLSVSRNSGFYREILFRSP